MSIRYTAVISLIAATIIGGASWFIQGWRLEAKYANLDRDHAKALEQLAVATIKSVEAARELEHQLNDHVEKELVISKQQAKKATDDAASYLASTNRLRQRIHTLVTYATDHDPTLAIGSKATGSAIDMLANVLIISVERTRQLATYADQARVAGLTCERIYDGVRKPT